MQIDYLPQCESTNSWAKENYAKMVPFGAVYTDNQVGGRGRLGRKWENAAGQALYYTALVSQPLVQPETLPQLMSIATRDALKRQFGISCQIKWPNDLLLNGKKIAGILCESTQTPLGRVWVLGVGVNLVQSQAHFDAQNLPYAGSLATQGITVDMKMALPELAARITAELMAQLPTFAEKGFAPLRADYCTACINLGRTVSWQKGEQTVSGVCLDVDDYGRLVVENNAGTQEIFTGEVSIQGIYGQM